MQLTVFGATGRTGRRIVELALERGHRVIALCREARALGIEHRQLETREGQLNDAEAVEQALKGSDAAVIAFGPRPPEYEIFCAAATAAILEAMRRQGVRRIICLTGAMIGEGVRRSWVFEQLTRFYRRRMPARAEDRAEQERLVKTSGLDWTLVKPPRLTEGPATGRYTWGPEAHVGLLSRLSRQDLARFILDEIESARDVDQAVVIRG
jgi:putative NADH-flavin reductase